MVVFFGCYLHCVVVVVAVCGGDLCSLLCGECVCVGGRAKD